MTKKTFTFFMAFLMATAIFAQQVEQVQRTVVTKRTATWCPNCGSWGWTLMEGLIADNADKAILIAAHENGSSLANPAAEEITANWGSFGQPTFFVNEVNQNVSSSSAAAKREDIKAQVDAAFASQPIANVGFAPTYNDGKIWVDAKVKFFQEATGEYFLGTYLLEDNVFANQSGNATDNNHMRVLQYSFTDGTWGLPLTNGNVAADTEFSQSFSLEIGDPEGSDYHVVGIIWKLEGGVYKPVNAWSTMEILPGTALSTDEPDYLASFKIQPTVASSQAIINLELAENQDFATVEVFNLNGQKVATLFDGELNAGAHSFALNRQSVGGDGTFIVRFSDGEKVSSQRVVFQ